MTLRSLLLSTPRLLAAWLPALRPTNRPQPRHRFSAAIRLLLAGALLAGAAQPRAAQADPAVTEYQLKAAFLYNFAKFVDWPAAAFADPATPFSLCVQGTEPYLAAREMLSGKTIRGRAIKVRHAESVTASGDCHLFFVADADAGGPRAVIHASGHALMVGEASDFIARGGVINLRRVDDRIRFDIARLAGEQQGFRFSAQLLRLANVVDPIR